MKTMTCKQLGGACDLEFSASTFEEIAKLSQNHGKEMFQQQDPDHLEAMSKMMKLAQNPVKVQEWMEEKRKEFNSLP